MFAVAAEVPGAAGYVHLRYAGLGANGQPGAVQALEEVLKLSKEAKAPLHVSHITSSGLAATPTLLKMVADAKAQRSGRHDRAVPVHRGHERHQLDMVRAGLAADARHQLRQAAMAEDRRVSDRSDVQEVPAREPGRRSHHPRDPAGCVRRRAQRSEHDDHQRRPGVSEPRRASAQLRDVGARAGSARARAEIADADGGPAQDDADAGTAARSRRAGDEEQRPGARRGGCRSRDLRSRDGRRQREVRRSREVLGRVPTRARGRRAGRVRTASYRPASHRGARFAAPSRTDRGIRPPNTCPMAIFTGV